MALRPRGPPRRLHRKVGASRRCSGCVAQPPGPQVGRHASTIQVVGVTDGGDAAITQDLFGGTRLWLSLDGTHEPVVVQLAVAKTLLLGRTTHGFGAAGRDDSRGLEIVSFDDAGSVISRTRIAPDPAIEDVVIDRGRVIVPRADQIVAVFDPSGRTIAELPAPAGHRIEHIVARGGHVLAITDSAGIWLDDTRYCDFRSATGALAKRTCSWSFGFSDVVRMEGPDEDSICEAR